MSRSRTPEPAAPDPAELDAAADALARGGIVCIPTETTYGLAVSTRSPAGLAALVALKGRDPAAPFGIACADADQARALARAWPPVAERLARAFWPGPLTLVVPAAPGLAPELVGPSGGVGVRVSSHPWPTALAARAGVAITATSANPSGAPPALTAAEARDYFGERIAVYLDAGPAAKRTASTVVEVGAGGAARVLRAGPIDPGPVLQGADG